MAAFPFLGLSPPGGGALPGRDNPAPRTALDRAIAVLPGTGNLLGGQRYARARLCRTERSSRLPPPAAGPATGSCRLLHAKPSGS